MTTGNVSFDKKAALSAAADLDALADRLEAAVGADSAALSIPAAGADEVSVRAAGTLTAVGASFVQQSAPGVDELRKLATAIRSQADNFGQVEDASVVDFVSL